MRVKKALRPCWAVERSVPAWPPGESQGRSLAGNVSAVVELRPGGVTDSAGRCLRICRIVSEGMLPLN